MGIERKTDVRIRTFCVRKLDMGVRKRTKRERWGPLSVNVSPNCISIKATSLCPLDPYDL